MIEVAMWNLNMALVFFFFFLLCTCMCFTTASEQDFISLDCAQENHGVYGKKSVLVCVVRSTVMGEEATIKTVIWKKNKDPLLIFSRVFKYLKKTDDFQFAEPAWYVRNNVSLMLTNTKMTDKGGYTCIVDTDMGIKEVTTSLSVTAEYNPPTMNSIPGENIKEDTDVTMFCNSTGGDRRGTIRWSDEYGTDWTRSSELESHKTEDGLFNLSSKFTVRGASRSTSSVYSCSVHNAGGVQEGKATLQLQFISGRTGDSNVTIKYVAPFVVIGSLVVGLLLALMLRRRSHRHQPVQMNDLEMNDLQPEIEKSPQDG